MLLSRFLKCPLVWLTATVLLLPVLCAAAEGDAQPKSKPPKTWLVVTRPMFVAAIKPLADHRRKDGFRVVVSTDAPPKAIAAAGKELAFILLVGDDEQGQAAKAWYLPARRVQGYYWQGRKKRTFASDSVYGDLDGDSVPDVPVGRIPARTTEQAALVVSKILSYEAVAPSLADLRMPFWAGAPMYGELVDSMATTMALGALNGKAPRWLTPWVQTADRKHPMCGWPVDQPADFTRQLTKGGALAVLMGHGDTEGFYSMRHEGQTISYYAASTGGMLDKGQVAPPMVVFTCSSGNFTASDPCMTEGFLLLPAGPVATIGATDETHPLPNYYSGLCLLDALRERPRRIGVLWLDSQLKGLKTSNFLAERLLRHAEGQIGLDSDVAQLKRDQPLLYALLGDPATKLRLPEKLHGKMKFKGGKWNWQVHKPKDATQLIVYHRPSAKSISRFGKPLGKDAARKAKTDTNDAFEFKKITSLNAKAQWSGSADTEGTLRFVAIGSGKLYAVGIALKRPAEEVD